MNHLQKPGEVRDDKTMSMWHDKMSVLQKVSLSLVLSWRVFLSEDTSELEMIDWTSLDTIGYLCGVGMLLGSTVALAVIRWRTRRK